MVPTQDNSPESKTMTRILHLDTRPGPTQTNWCFPLISVSHVADPPIIKGGLCVSKAGNLSCH